jgi:hypothetical protein
MHISFQIIQSAKTKAVQICVDDEGLAMFIDTLDKLRGTGSHVHLLAKQNGGTQLSNKTPFGEDAVGEVIITHGGD